MNVTLIDYTGKGSGNPDYAANLLIFTKSTRLEMKPGLLSEIEGWPADRRMAELEYMSKTIPSSWEFCDFTFLLEGVTRAFTHQFVRTRTASFAQQTMRVLNVDGWTYGTGPSIENYPGDPSIKSIYHNTMDLVDTAYKALIEEGIKIEDARGLLPTNIHTNIVAKMNLRTFCEMARKRASIRTQDEYRDLLDAMKAAAISALPWVEVFLNRDFDRAAAELEAIIKTLWDEGFVNDFQKVDMIKLIDQMRMTA